VKQSSSVLPARTGRIFINLFLWRWLAVDGVAPATFAIEIDVAMHPPTIVEEGRGIAEPEFVQQFEYEPRDDPARSLAELTANFNCSVGFMCIALGNADAVDLASAWAIAGKAAGASFVTLAVLGRPETAGILGRGGWDIVLIAKDAASLNHLLHITLGARPLIGYNMAEVMPHWRGRTGWIERCNADIGELNAILLEVQARFGKPAAGLTLLLTDHLQQGGNQLLHADRIAESLDRAAGDANTLVVMNEPFLGDEPDGVELVVLFEMRT
jgi:hypothetical protein